MKLRSKFFETDITTQDEMFARASLSVKCEDAMKPVLPDVVVAQFLVALRCTVKPYFRDSNSMSTC
jgi:hypothetical protein